jgi:hypothetical protein
MKRPNVNFAVDCLGFAGFVLLTATGVLMRYVLPPGSGHSTTIWTLDRHEWGSIHFWIAIAFLAVLAFHLFLHWRDREKALVPVLLLGAWDWRPSWHWQALHS